MLGCFRKGEAEDPEVYVTSVAMVLTRYPERVARYVTHPAHGLPGRLNWLPTIAEVRSACEAEMKPIYEQAARMKRQQGQNLMLAAPDKPSEEQRAEAVAYWQEMRKTFGNPEVAKPGETAEEALARLEELKGQPLSLSPEALKKYSAELGRLA